MKKLISLFIITLSFSLVNVFATENESENSKGAITGRVVDSENLPLPGATVFIESLNKGTITDNNGVYRLVGLNPAKYSVTVSYVGV